MLGRYFYFESNGSSANPGNHLAEVQIVDTEGVNRALGMGLLRYSAVNGSSDPTKVTDGNTSYSSHFDFGEGRQYVVIDLGDVYDISYIKVWRYYSGGRTYKDVFIKVSLDDVNYTTVFSSAVDGTYAETSSGKQIDILNLEHDIPEEPESPEVNRLYYNGVLLPAIPADVLAAYPYAWIRKNDTTSYYELIMSDNPFYWKSSAIYESGGNAGRPYYRIWQGDADRAMGWTDYGSHTYSSWTWSEKQTVLWSNHDMPYKSATATVFYIRGSEPIEESEYVDQSGKKAYYSGVLLPAIPQGVLGGYPYAWIRRNLSSGVCELICFPNGAYYDGSRVWDKGPVHGPRYKTTIGSDAENWEYVDCTYSAYSLSDSEVLWSNHDIPNGSATATDIYVYGSEPELELPEEPEVPVVQLTKLYYNGVLLPAIPEDALAEYPYAWIKKFGDEYQLIMAKYPFYTDGAYVYCSNGLSETKARYSISVSNVENVSEWTFVTYETGYYYANILIWSNHDMPHGSATATDIHFYGSEPVSRFDAEYIKLEYIEATGTQYIDTGYYPKADTRVIADVHIFRIDENVLVYGAHGNDQSFYCMTRYGSTATFWQINYGNSYTYSGAADPVGIGRSVIDQNGANVTIKGPSSMYDCTDTVPGTFIGVSSYPMYVFTYNNEGIPATCSSLNVYSFRIYEGEKLVRNLVPAKRKSDNEVGLYDTVNGVFYANQGTGSFIEGPELPDDAVALSDYYELTHIEATGTQFINTGYIATSKTAAEYKVNYTSIGNLGPHLLSGNKFYFPLIRTSAYGHLLVYRGGNEFTSNAITGTTGVDYVFKGFFDDEIVINDTSYGTRTCGSTTTDTVPLHLMTYGYEPNNELYLFKGKLYYCKIYEDGTLVRDFVPVMRKSDSVVGLYDKVNNVFYMNNGTGSFKPGLKMSLIEKGYTPLEFIQSSGTQYINTGYYPNANTRVEAELHIYNHEELTRLYGVVGNNQNFAFRLGQGNYVAGVKYPAWILSYGESTVSTSITHPIERGKHKIDHTGSTVTVTGPSASSNCSLTSNSTFSVTSSYPLYIFAVNNGETPVDISSFSLYSFKIYDGETLVRDFAPAKNNYGVIGLYDHVEGVFYTNSGSGEFSSNLPYIPPRLPRGYTELEYIESDGSQYIDTGFCATSHTHAYIEVMVKKNEPTAMIYGSYGDSCNFAHVNTSSKGYTLQYCSGSSTALQTSLGYKASLDHTGSSSYVNDGTYGRVMWVAYPTFDNNNPYPMYLFTVNNAGVPEPSNAMRLYIFKVRDEGVMVRCFVPAKRNSDGEIGVYDTINDVFYTNTGTGTFTAGPEIVYAFEAGITIINGIPAVITDGRVCLNGVICRITAGTAIVNGVVKRVTFTT